MSFTVAPSARILVQGMPSVRGYPENSPLAFHSVAEVFHAESGSETDGRLDNDKALRANGKAVPVDTYLADGSHVTLSGWTYTGSTWNTGTGVWSDDRIDSRFNRVTIHTTDGGVTVAKSIDSAVPAVLTNCRFAIGRGALPPTTDSNQYSAANYYTKLILPITENEAYQFVAEYGSPFRLEYSNNAQATWKKVHVMGSHQTEDLMRAVSYELVLNVNLDKEKGVLSVKCEGFGELRHSPEDKTGIKNPTAGYIRFSVKNGWATFQKFPIRYGSLSVSKSPVHIPGGVNGRTPLIVPNSLSGGSRDQTHTTEYTTDGRSISYNATAFRPDDGSGLGSAEPPVFADVTLVLPSRWSNAVNGRPDFRFTTLPTTFFVEETQTFDPVSRCRTSSATINCHNHDLALNDLVGNLHCEIDLSNGHRLGRRITGISRNPRYVQAQANLTTQFSVTDYSLPLQQPISQEVCFDSWCLWSAVRYVCEVCGIHPMFMAPQMPLYIPPGATLEAPYGPAGEDCPYYVLSSGTGLNPRHKHLPQESGWSILLGLVQERGQFSPLTQSFDIFWMGFDPFGYFHFEPYHPLLTPPKKVFYDLDPTGGSNQLINSISWNIDTDSMRTNIHLQGIDAFTNELLAASWEAPPWVKQMSGFPRKYIERTPRFNSEEEMEGVLTGMAYAASLPDFTGTIEALFDPDLYVQDVISIVDFRHGVYGNFVIENLVNRVGAYPDGHQVCESVMQVRATTNYR